MAPSASASASSRCPCAHSIIVDGISFALCAPLTSSAFAVAFRLIATAPEYSQRCYATPVTMCATSSAVNMPRRSFIALLATLPLPFSASTAGPIPLISQPAPPPLPTRLDDPSPRLPPLTVTAPDLFYPVSFDGTWDTSSITLSVAAPCGASLFGRPGALRAAQESVSTDAPLRYRTRFVPSPNGAAVVPDRSFNLESIGAVALGPKSILQCEGGASKAKMSVRPAQSGGTVFTVTLSIRTRQQEYASNSSASFAGMEGSAMNGGTVLLTSETVTQRVQADGTNSTPLVKDVETTTIYFLDGDREVQQTFAAKQRTCTYLAQAELRFQETRGKPVDVRWYDLVYSKM